MHYETADVSPEVGLYASLAIDTSGKVHISYYDYANPALKYATNASDGSATPTPFQTPTPPQPTPTPTVVATPTATQTPTPIVTPTVPVPTLVPSCKPENMTADPENVKVSIGSSAQVAITITCEDDTLVEGEKVKSQSWFNLAD